MKPHDVISGFSASNSMSWKWQLLLGIESSPLLPLALDQIKSYTVPFWSWLNFNLLGCFKVVLRDTPKVYSNVILAPSLNNHSRLTIIGAESSCTFWAGSSWLTSRLISSFWNVPRRKIDRILFKGSKLILPTSIIFN